MVFPWDLPMGFSRSGALGGLLRPGRVALAARGRRGHRGRAGPGSLKGLPGRGNPTVLWEDAGRNGGKHAEKVWDINFWITFYISRNSVFFFLCVWCWHELIWIERAKAWRTLRRNLGGNCGKWLLTMADFHVYYVKPTRKWDAHVK